MSGDTPVRASAGFDLRPHLRRDPAHPRGYLDVTGRLLWLRAEQPAARLTTEHVVLDERQAVFRATVELPDGALGTGYGAATRDEAEDYVERAETRAMGRALAVLGFGAQYTREFDLETSAPAELAPPQAETATLSRPAGRSPESAPARQSSSAAEEQPATTPSQPPRMRVVHPHELEQAPEHEPELEPEPETEHEHVLAPDQDQDQDQEPAQEPAAPERRQRTARPLAAEEPEESFEAANYSWNEFWRWARPLGYRSRQALDELLGVATEEMTPREVRRLLLQHRAEHGESD